ncbi:sulfur carrier protein ThiS [Acetivibrio mesophilus]|uniref:Sulfur carrier protein ThiS n=1 Tax=Acetivibrio mesophilus TaxID=2487273 RepID=A0A4Q0IAS4_9FIRM|nr:sulfur carrier protein ThiS [Acetivibrio mesophilus]ODM25586.1 thiamine biosynthesis protein ThiS [Clostridium sp. Bc-iso-3]RXE60172.1 sulfur carrier protein ThiS [Acetivibrio mesophilus]HHV29069.1 sulfur carrier protein ThiS [Clostridium sp.]
MIITLNGKQTEIGEKTALMDLIQSKGLEPESIVIEYNRKVLRKEEWDSVVLKENDKLEVLRFVGGG